MRQTSRTKYAPNPRIERILSPVLMIRYSKSVRWSGMVSPERSTRFESINSSRESEETKEGWCENQARVNVT
jgi:hypothetical protein